MPSVDDSILNLSSTAAPSPLPTPPNNSNNTRNRTPKPNYRHIHRFPLPLIVHPLPPLIPHNPVSVISVLLSYLTFLISPPKREAYAAYFDSATSSVHVTDEKTVRALWEMGFFGKGSLSRSEPSWMDRERKRRGGSFGITSEEHTRQRRAERREFKLARARKEQQAITQRLKEESLQTGDTIDPLVKDTVIGQEPPPDISASVVKLNSSSVSSTYSPMNHSKVADDHAKAFANTLSNGSAMNTTGESPKTVRFSTEVTEKQFNTHDAISNLHNNTVKDAGAIHNEEHLQLSLEEAYFLVYGLGVLEVYNNTRTEAIPTDTLFDLFRRHSYFPSLHSSKEVQPDDPFMLSYAVYHHFRSLGWVVRSGVKFGVDYILYNRGPVFSHAEFAVIILPSYEHPYWSDSTAGRNKVAKAQKRSWWWLHCVNRVQTQVRKTLVLCFVNVPPPISNKNEAQDQAKDIEETLRAYTVRELIVRRWIPNRSRD